MKRCTACLQRTSLLISSQNDSSLSVTVAARDSLRGHSDWLTCTPLVLSLAQMKVYRVERSHWGLTDFSRSGIKLVFSRVALYSTGIS